LGINHPYSQKALKVANKIFHANKDMPEVAAINWKITVITTGKN